MAHSFELLVQRNISKGMSTKEAIASAASEYPQNHEEFLLSGKKTLSLYSESKYTDFRSAIKAIAEAEGISYSAALLEAGRRHPKLYKQYITELLKEKADD